MIKPERELLLISENDKKRFWSYVERREPAECWPWTGGKFTSGGYGQFWLQNTGFRANRLSYILHFGAIPQGMMVCHTCDRPICCNPAHLFLGTRRENILDCLQKGRLARGKQHGQSKLTEDNVREMRSLYAMGGVTQQALANRFRVGLTAINFALRHKTWTHIE